MGLSSGTKRTGAGMKSTEIAPVFWVKLTRSLEFLEEFLHGTNPAKGRDDWLSCELKCFGNAGRPCEPNTNNRFNAYEAKTISGGR
jgi:hypothetical protein